MQAPSRRRFLADVGKGMLVASVGATLCQELGLGTVLADDEKARLNFGSLESLATLMQSTPPEKLLPQIVEKLNSETDLKTVVAAAALANARAFGGNDYIGFHTFMALGPAYAMAAEMPADRRALPILKVLYRNSNRIQAYGNAEKDNLHWVEAGDMPAHPAEALQEATRSGEVDRAEKTFASIIKHEDAGEAFNHLQMAVADEVDVHRVVLCWRSWSTLDLTGQEHAHTLLRQSVRYCVDVDKRTKTSNYPASPIRTLLPKLLDQYKLVNGSPSNKKADDAWIDRMANLVTDSSREQAAEAVAAALAEGFTIDDIGEVLTLASNQLVLRDKGRLQQWASEEKPAGSVHGDSVGVHASDSANAWRNIAGVSNARNAVASMIVGAFHTAGQLHANVGKEWYPLPEHLEKITSNDPDALLKGLGGAITEKDQFRATALVTKYGQISQDSRPVFDLLLKYGCSEDGALHAEKYYRTVSEEFARTRAAFRWRQLAALARVTASEYGRTAPGYKQACELLKIG
jgi:hypothetical protein